jgi:hypothetical protein
MDFLFQFQSLVLDLEEEIAAAENVLVLRRSGFRLFVLPRHQIAAQLTCQAAGESDEALRVLSQVIFAHSGFAVEAVERGLGSNAHQVAVSFFVFR